MKKFHRLSSPTKIQEFVLWGSGDKRYAFTVEFVSPPVRVVRFVVDMFDGFRTCRIGGWFHGFGTVETYHRGSYGFGYSRIMPDAIFESMKNIVIGKGAVHLLEKATRLLVAFRDAPPQRIELVTRKSSKRPTLHPIKINCPYRVGKWFNYGSVTGAIHTSAVFHGYHEQDVRTLNDSPVFLWDRRSRAFEFAEKLI